MTPAERSASPSPFLTVDQVRARVAAIAAGGFAAANDAEARLWVSVLTDIANGNPDAAAVAREALATTDIEFPA